MEPLINVKALGTILSSILSIQKILMLSTKYTACTKVTTLSKNWFSVLNLHQYPTYLLAYAGSCTDRFITEDSEVFKKFTPYFMVLSDKGFNVHDLFLCRQVTCVTTICSKQETVHTLRSLSCKAYSKSKTKDSYRKSYGQIERISTAWSQIATYLY